MPVPVGQREQDVGHRQGQGFSGRPRRGLCWTINRVVRRLPAIPKVYVTRVEIGRSGLCAQPQTKAIQRTSASEVNPSIQRAPAWRRCSSWRSLTAIGSRPPPGGNTTTFPLFARDVDLSVAGDRRRIVAVARHFQASLLNQLPCLRIERRHQTAAVVHHVKRAFL